MHYSDSRFRVQGPRLRVSRRPRAATVHGGVFGMKRVYRYLVVLAVCCLLTVLRVEADSQPPPQGGVLPDFALVMPKDLDHQQYLGITGKDSFKVSEIKARVLIIEIFNMY